MRWLVTGARGMLGRDVVALLTALGDDVTALGRDDLDVRDHSATREIARGHDVVLNCAAWTAVDDAEAHEPDAFAVNAVGAGNLARAARLAGARIVQISTDYVFSGERVGEDGYPEDAPVAPRSAYGRTKAAGEWAVRAEAPDHLVVRTAWLYGSGPCFPRTALSVVRAKGAIDVVDDQIGQPTSTVDLADLVVRLVRADAPAGTYHGTASGRTSWFGFARSVVEAAGFDTGVVRATTSSAFPRPAVRPAFSVLGHDRLEAAGVAPIGPWEDRWREHAADVLQAPAESLS
ncbi:dTDP-4-dehydrorhamnose reductase [Cellulomonas sp. URHD0024]|uniref:dTDP-4-dehydrorhamnose reductase n=1 Tax=Cellulomonas sp. URHD0024 TaxID=1302620 RepID=UPI000420AC9B|nr:dTDP-4-dehydrorhamnose reductase [Cellulomonas sp. URHD0024]